MAQMTESLARAILNGDGCTRHELEQLCRHFLATPASPATINHDGIDRKLIDDATPAGSASGEDAADDAFYNLRELTQCRCHPAFTDRGRVDPDCNHDYRDDVEALAAALAEARRDAERLDAIERGGLSVSCQWKNTGWAGGPKWSVFVYASEPMVKAEGKSLRKCIDAALHQRKENGHAG